MLAGQASDKEYYPDRKQRGQVDLYVKNMTIDLASNTTPILLKMKFLSPSMEEN